MSEMIWNGYSVTRLSKERLNDLAILFRSVYGRASPQKYFHLKYDTAFTGVSYTGYVAYDMQNQPAAFYGVVPCFLQYDGNKILAAQSVDTMTHPLHRNKGLFVALANLTVELCRNEGIRILFGFPNQHSLPGFIGKLQWHLAGHMAQFTLPVKSLPLEQIVTKFPFLKNMYNLYTDFQLKKLRLAQEGLNNSFTDKGVAVVCRDEDYLRYKTYSKTIVIKIHHADVWFKLRNGLMVGDMTVPDDFEEVILNLKKLTRRLGLKQVTFQLSEGTPLYSRLQNFVTPIPGFPVIIKDLGSGLPTDKMKFSFADTDIF